MPFKINLANRQDSAKELTNVMQTLYTVIVDMDNNIANDNYRAVVNFPAAFDQLAGRIQTLNTKGHNYKVFAPFIANDFGYSDAANVEADYDQIRSLCVQLKNLIVANGAKFLHSINANGTRVYDQPLDSAEKTALQNQVAAIRALFDET